MLNWDEGLLLRLAAEGMTNQEIADSLGQKHQTIKNRFNVLLAKVGAKNKLHAYKLGVEDGTIKVERKPGAKE